MQQKEEEGGEYENIAVELVLEDYQSINQTLTVYEKNWLHSAEWTKVNLVVEKNYWTISQPS